MALFIYISCLLLAVVGNHQVKALIPDGCFGILDIAFVLDQSESIRENDPIGQPDHNWNVYRNFVKSVVADLPFGYQTQVAMVKYSSEAKLMWPLDRYQTRPEFDNAVDGLTLDGGNTNTADALGLVYSSVFGEEIPGDRPHASNIVVVMTDGLSNLGQQNLRFQAEALHGEGVEIYVVGIGQFVDKMEMRSMVTDFSKHVLTVDDFDRLSVIQNSLVRRICGLPPIINVTDPINCPFRIDLAFIVDNSGSIGLDNYVRLKHFLVSFIRQFKTPSKHRFGVVRFSDDVTLEFQLGMYSNQADLEDRIYRMAFKDDATNTAGGIRVATDQIFSGSPGDRAGVKNVALLIADGASNRDERSTFPQARRAKRMGIEMYVIGVTNKINYVELKTIASDPDYKYFHDATAVQWLGTLTYNIVQSMCEA